MLSEIKKIKQNKLIIKFILFTNSIKFQKIKIYDYNNH